MSTIASPLTNTDDPGAPGQGPLASPDATQPANAPGALSAGAQQFGQPDDTAPGSLEYAWKELQRQIKEVEDRRTKSQPYQDQLRSMLQGEMGPDAVQKYLPKPTAANMVQDGLYNFVQANMAEHHGTAWEPIQQTRLKNAMQLQQARLKAASDELQQQRYSDASDNSLLTNLRQMAYQTQQALTAKANSDTNAKREAAYAQGISDRMVSVTPDMALGAPELGFQIGQQIPASTANATISYMKLKQQPDKLNQVALALKAAGADPQHPETMSADQAKRAMAILKPQMPGITLTPEAVQFWAQAAAAGVPLPSMGMGAAGATARQQIINAAPGASGGTPLAVGKANREADATSLRRLQPMYDSVVSFENTANKNLDLFMDRAKDVVDSGSPWINTPLRLVGRQGLGSADIAAFDAARQVALTEIAKVVNNPTLASTLSDSARKEVLNLVPADATLNQIYHVVSTLRLDMQNRRDSINGQIAEIKNRMTTAATPPAKPTNPAGTSPPPATTPPKPQVQFSPSTKQYRYSIDGGKTWQMGQPPQQ